MLPHCVGSLLPKVEQWTCLNRIGPVSTLVRVTLNRYCSFEIMSKKQESLFSFGDHLVCAGTRQSIFWPRCVRRCERGRGKLSGVCECEWVFCILCAVYVCVVCVCVVYVCVVCVCACVCACEHVCVRECEGLWLNKMIQQSQPQWMNLKRRGNEYIKGGQCLHSRGFYWKEIEPQYWDNQYQWSKVTQLEQPNNGGQK